MHGTTRIPIVAGLTWLLCVMAASPAGPSLAQEDLGLTVYSGNLGLVRRSVAADLAAGETTVRVDDLPANIDPATLVVADAGVTLLGVHGFRRYQDAGSEGSVSIAIDLDVQRATRGLNLAFLTRGLTWSAHYTMVVGPDERTAAFDGFANVGNSSGMDFVDARLQLVAGAIQQAGTGRYEADQLRGAMAREALSIEEATFADYHLYTVAAPVTLRNGEERRLRLMGSRSVRVQKRYVSRSSVTYAQQRSEPETRAVSVGYRVERIGAGDLDREPLPAGTVRLFQPDAAGRLQLLGMSTIPNTPRGEDLWLSTGQAFDVLATRVQTEYERVAGGVYETAWRIDLTNRTDRDVEVDVIESVAGDWEILSASHEPEKLSAGSVRFRVSVPADGQTRLEYRVSVKP